MGKKSTDNKGNVAVLLSGRGSNFVSILQYSRREKSNFNVSLVISDNEASQGLKRARQEGLLALFVNPAAFSDRFGFETEICRHLIAHQIRLVCLAGYMRIVGKTLLNQFPEQILNIHPSLLPAFPGLNAQKQALDWGVRVSGCTVHFVDSGTDSGPIILQKAVPIFNEDDVDALSARILAEEHRIYPLAISLYFSGHLTKQGRRVKINQ